MDGLGGHYAKWNKSDGERWIPYDITYIWNLKNTTNYIFCNITKKKQIHRSREQTSGYQEEREGGKHNIVGGD